MNYKTLRTLLTCLLTLFICQAHALNPTEADKRRCFMDDPEGRTITFLYCMDEGYWTGTVNTAYVRGSFNNWKDAEITKLSFDEESNCWYCTVSYDYVNVPGNSGQPEYKFVINGSYKSAPSWLTDGYVFMTSDQNMIVVFSTDDFEQIKANSAIAGYIRPLADFNLDDPVDQTAISNFRCVPGTKQLFRSYHPYKSSRGDNKGVDTEYWRLYYVDKLATDHGIVSDICLSDNDENTLTTYTTNGQTYMETIPEYYQKIIDNQHVLYVNANNKVPSYSYVYTKPTSKYFGDWVKQIVEFIIDDNTPAPFQIHCRLGTDRTGVFCAVLAALCGAQWDAITADYQATNNMQIREFRDWHLLAYTFRQLLNVYDVSTVENLKEALSNYFITNGYLTQEQIDKMNEKLNSKVYKNITVKAYSPDGVPTIWWWGGGDKCPSASKTYEWVTRPEMNPLEGYDGWYYWTFADVDNSKGISYILTSPGTGSKSEDLHTYNDECRDQYYNITAAPSTTGISLASANSTTLADIYSLNGQLIRRSIDYSSVSQQLPGGIYVVKVGNRCTKVAIAR